MDPVQKLWMYENWLEDQNDKAELAKNHAYLLGSFWNPEAVKQLTQEGNVHTSTDEEFEESSKIVREMNNILLNQQNNTVRRRKRRKVING